MYDRLTQGDIDKMQAEINERKLKRRPELIEAVKVAREQGDLSENFEYYAAKREKNLNESRIRYLERMVNTARVVSMPDREGEAGMNKEIELYYPEDDETETVRIVTTIRSNPLKGLISIESPMGKALLGHKAGDTVRVQTETGASYEVTIRSVSAALDEAGDEIAGY